MGTVLPVLLAACLFGPPDPGQIVVVNDGAFAVTFPLPDGTPYQLDWEPGPVVVYLDRAMTRFAIPYPTIYVAHNRGDFTGDHLLDAADIPAFIAALMSGTYDARGDFTNDGHVDATDVAPFAEAVLNEYPAEGVTLFVRAGSISDALGDKVLNLMTDPDHDGTYTVSQSQAMTFVYFESYSHQSLGTPIEFVMLPGVEPLAFDENTTAAWEGYVTMSAGTTPPLVMKFDASQVRDRTPDYAEILIGDGALQGPVPLVATLGGPGPYAYAHGRVTFDFNGFLVRTPEFQHTVDLQNLFRFCDLVMDDDPVSYEPTYGTSMSDPPILHVANPDDPQLNTYWGHRVALELPVAQSADTVASAPDSISVDLLSYGSGGELLDSITGIALQRIDDDGDSYSINFRSPLSQPFVFVDATVNKADFPELKIIQVFDGGWLVLARR